MNTHLPYPLRGGATAISLNKTAWVELAANGGNDSTGQIGDPAKPFATGTAALVALGVVGGDAYHLHFGVGAHETVMVNYSGILSLSGEGHLLSSVQIEFVAEAAPSFQGRSAFIQDVGFQTISIATISCEGADSNEDGQAGGAGGNLEMYGIKLNGLASTAGGDGFSGDIGTAGGPGGYILAKNCSLLGSLTTKGGTGGNSSEVGANGGDAGTGGNMFLYDVDGEFEDAVSLILELLSGDPGAGDSPGAGANGGGLKASRSSFFSADFTGTLANGGVLNMRFCRYASLTSDIGGGEFIANIVSGVFVP